MKKKKLFIILGIILSIILLGIILYFVLFKQDKDSTLTVMDKQWIQANKNKLIDIQIETDIPIFNYNGEGVFFDFLTSFEENVGLEFNRVAIKENNKNIYAFKLVDEITDNDVVVYKDNYALVSKVNKKYSNLSELENITIGVLGNDLQKAKFYLNGSKNVNLKTYSDLENLLTSINNVDEQSNSETDMIMVLKNYNLDDIVKNDLIINYNLSDFSKYYVISLGTDDKLNSIIKKYYKKWYNENYQKSYQTNFSDSYFMFSGIAEKERVDFTSKRYSYGFVSNSPYNLVIDGNLLGINASIMRDFSKVADIEISFEEYKSNEELINKFNENKIDFFFNNVGTAENISDAKNTISTFDEKIVYVSHINNNLIINSINSLKGLKVKTLKNTKISKYLTSNEIDIKEYNNIEELIESIDNNSILAIDKETFNYYVRKDLSDFKIDFEDKIDLEYTFTIKNIDANKVFNEFFDFYLSFIDEKSNLNKSYNELITTKSRKNILFNLILYAFAIVGILTIIFRLFKLFSKLKSKKDTLSKEHKLKYVDMLTSLKNRNYLNDNIEKWDNSEVYPQTIIIIDLNNVAYINDNYGHQEGDNLIKEAANILIKAQISNTEIIRTNGNEFLIYMVGYDEKQVIAYIRKLNKEFKELAHGFGAAIGYSTINDGIKTIDDAVNEATLDMRNNKEDVNN